MGDASKRKKLGVYPKQTPKRIPKVRKKIMGNEMDGMATALALLMAVRRYPKLRRMDD